MALRKLVRPWDGDKPPKCWAGGVALWRAAWGERGKSVFSPCHDCTPEYREAMKAQLRCSRPEVIFFRSTDGDVEGVCADDPRYARALLGISIPRMERISPLPVISKQWRDLMDYIEKRAHAKVRAAIRIWKKRG